jgi:hypothetical protein
MTTETETTTAPKAADIADNFSNKKPKPAKVPKAQHAAHPKPAPKPRAEPKPKPVSARQQIIDNAAAGFLPTPPDFGAETHKRFRKRHSELVALVEAGDLKALRAYKINPVSSSPKALDRYRNLSVVALESQRKAAKAKAAG